MSMITLAHDGAGGLDRAALEQAVRDLGVELHALLERIDPARFRAEQQESARRALLRLRERAAALRSRIRGGVDAPVGLGDPAQIDSDDDDAALAAALELLAATAEAATADDAGPGRIDWAALRARLAAAYDRLSLALRRRAIETPRNRPTNYLRNLYHVGNGVGILVYIHMIVGRSGMWLTAAAFFTFAWTAELLRRRVPAVNAALMRAFGTVAHPDEHWKINSATWMVTALLLLASFYSLPACAVGVAVLGVADPAAALVGRRFGRRRLRGSKTLEGTAAFVLAGAAAGWAALALWHPTVPATAALVAALCGALPAGIGELFAGDHQLAGRRLHLDDNFVIPLVAATGAALALAALG